MVAQMTFSLSKVPLFAGISPDVLAPLFATCRHVRLEKREFLFREGDKGKEMFIIESGQLRIWKQNPDGYELELALLGPNEVVGELEVIDGKPRSAHAQATEYTELIALTRESLFNHIGMYPGMASHMLVILSERLRRNNQLQMELHRTHKPTARVAQLLLLSCDEKGHLLKPKLNLPEMAYVLGMETTALERILSEFEIQGAIRMTSTDQLVITNFAALQQAIVR